MKQARTYQRRRYHDLQSALERLGSLEAERRAIFARFPDLRLEARQLRTPSIRHWEPRRVRRPSLI